ncbi:MAG TPA: HepT-like ribonuclease domain-containing protein [Bacteroidales bacterium]|nr:HepT-like ribonuclease domain-containing protein [Bacteroidales bacterium]
MLHKVPKLLQDISLSCIEMSDFIADKTFEQFQRDRMLQLAIEREFEIIGEALSRLARLDEENLAHNIPEYRKIIDFRNIVAHGYDIIDEAAMWDFAENRVPELLEKVENY